MEGRALGDIILHERQVRAFGMSTFVDGAFLDAFLAEPHPQIGRRLLLEAYDARSPVLTIDHIARGNREGGLHLVVVMASYDAQAAIAPALFAALLVAFLESHRGYRIERMVNEAFTPDAVLNAESAGLVVVRRFDALSTGSGFPSVLGVMTREHAIRTRAILLPSFIYDPPRLHLTRSEQQLLTAALSGEPDERLSVMLNTPLTSVKARWMRIQQRASQHAPELFEGLRPRTGNRRGARTRHLLLEYVRRHPSELAPYAWRG